MGWIYLVTISFILLNRGLFNFYREGVLQWVCTVRKLEIIVLDNCIFRTYDIFYRLNILDIRKCRWTKNQSHTLTKQVKTYNSIEQGLIILNIGNQTVWHNKQTYSYEALVYKLQLLYYTRSGLLLFCVASCTLHTTWCK